MSRLIIKFIIVVITVVSILSLSASAYGTDSISERQYYALHIDELEDSLPDEAAEMLGGMDITDSGTYKQALFRLLNSIESSTFSFLKAAVKNATVIIMISVITGFAVNMIDGTALAAAADYLPLVGILAVSVVSFGDINSFAGISKELLGEMSDFSKVLLPTLSSAAAASGAITSASAKCAAATIFIDLLINISEKVILPLVYIYLAASLGHAAFGTQALAGAAKFVKWLASTVLTIIMITFTAFLTISGIITGTADATATKITKTALGTMLPVVGGILSDAAGSILAGASLLRNAVGVFGMLSVLAVCLFPILKIAANYLCYKAAAGITSAIAEPKMSTLVGNVSSGFGMILGMTGACAIMLFLSIVSMLQGTGVI